MSRRIRTFSLITGLGVTLALWLASYFIFSFASADTLRYIQLEGGAILLHIYGGERADGTAQWGWLGYDGLRTWILPRVAVYSDKLLVVAPLWIPALLFAAPLLWRRQDRQIHPPAAR